jgi:N-acetyl-anhydromuramyl-L-alanine amidase AmpD
MGDSNRITVQPNAGKKHGTIPKKDWGHDYSAYPLILNLRTAQKKKKKKKGKRKRTKMLQSFVF